MYFIIELGYQKYERIPRVVHRYRNFKWVKYILIKIYDILGNLMLISVPNNFEIPIRLT